MIKRALDAGAHGIVTPMCHSEVRRENPRFGSVTGTQTGQSSECPYADSNSNLRIYL